MSIPNTKTELLHEASRMLLSKGLNGFSLQELAASLNIKKASVFHHYPSKNALAIELYRFYQNAFLAWVEKYKHLAPEKQIMQYAETLTRWISEKQRVCPVGALSLEWQQVDPDLQTEIKKLHELQKDWLNSLFKQMDISIPRGEAVICTMSLLQGSLQLARITGDPNLGKKNLKSYLKSIKA
ncbi:TetR/AcrR family transcriptional regulator [Peredibacter sp. HCB2-198]|uniref:TetR/AcrR family transcriptional regulator n=1 Tax=Peredibacter sp. HCB2-198 TaxID=3383025 RepID=UPI0038B41F24